MKQKTNKLLSDISKGRKHSEDSKSKMLIVAKLRKGINSTIFGKNHTTDTPADKYLNISETTLRRYKEEGNILNSIYLISKN